MNLLEAFEVIGGLSGIVAILILVWKRGFLFGKIDETMHQKVPLLSDKVDKLDRIVAEANVHLAKLDVKVDTIWSTIVEEALTHAMKRVQEPQNPGRALSKLIDECLEKHNVLNSSFTSSEAALLLVRNCSQELATIAQKAGIDYLEVLGAAIIQLRKRMNG